MIKVKVGQFKITSKGNVKWKWDSPMRKWATWGHVIMPHDFETNGAKLFLDTSLSRFEDSTSFQLNQEMVNDLTECFRLFCAANGVKDESIQTSYERIGEWRNTGCYNELDEVRFMQDKFPDAEWNKNQALSFSSSFHQDVIKCLQESGLVTSTEVQAAIDQVAEVWG